MDELGVRVGAPRSSAEKLVSLVQEIAPTHSDHLRCRRSCGSESAPRVHRCP